jgi:hypothetical protein
MMGFHFPAFAGFVTLSLTTLKQMRKISLNHLK